MTIPSAVHPSARRWVQPLGARPPAGGGVGSTARSLSTLLSLGLPVPPAFAISAEARPADGAAVPAELAALIADGVRDLERRSGRRLGAELRLVVRDDPLGEDAGLPAALGVASGEAVVRAVEALWAGERRVAITVQVMADAARDAASGSG